MRHALALRFALPFAFLACAGTAWAAGLPIPPPPTRWVTDTVGLIAPDARAGLEAKLEAYQRRTGHQVVVWIGGSIAGAPLDEWAVKTFAAWKLGRKAMDDGVALFVLASDRLIDIEVGYGLEDKVPDAIASRIIHEIMAPRLRAGDGGGAVRAGVDALLAAIEGRPVGDLDQQPSRAPGAGLGPVRLIIYGVLLLAFLVFLALHPRLALLFLWNILAGGGRGGGFGGGDGGGFSGGDMWWLSRKHFARRFDHDGVKRAIEDAERQTSGEIVVSLAPLFLGSVHRAAERAFARLAVSRTRERNGVLFFIVPSRRRFVILGDVGIHAKVGAEFWEAVAQSVSSRLHAGDLNGGIAAGIAEVGRRLAEHFPYDRAGDVNELPDEPDV
jgi:uncharacterized protein